MHFTDHMVTVEWTPDRAGTTPGSTAYAPLTLDPATAVLHYAQEIFEGMKAYRHDDGRRAVPARGERAAHDPLVASPGVPRAARDHFVQAVDALVAVDQRWVPDAGGGEEPLPAAVHVRHRGVPRRASGPHVTFLVIASPAGAYFKGGVKPVTLWLTENYTRAGRGGMGAAKTGGNYASSLVAQQEAPRTAATRSSSSTRQRASTSRSSAA